MNGKPSDHDLSPVDRVLDEAGARWRAGQPAPVEPNVRDLLGNGGHRPGRGRYVAVAAGLVVALLVAVDVAHGRFAAHRPAGPPVAVQPDPVVRAGDQVEGFGYVLSSAPGLVRLCRVLTVTSTAASCEDPPVSLDGVDVASLPGRQQRGRVVFSSEARVAGVYLGRAGVSVRAVTAARPDELDVQPVQEPPCAAPAAGWQDRALPEGQQDAVDAFVRAHADRYSGVWVSFSIVTPYSHPRPIEVPGWVPPATRTRPGATSAGSTPTTCASSRCGTRGRTWMLSSPGSVPGCA